MAEIRYYGDEYVIKTIKSDLTPKLAPHGPVHDKGKDVWVLPDSDVNIRYLLEKYNERDFSAAAKVRNLQYKQAERKSIGFPKSHDFAFPPMERQWDALDLAWREPRAALFLEMGCGKTFIAINTALARVKEGQINALLVIAPTPVKPVWEIEFEKHCNEEYDLHVVNSGGKKAALKFMDEPPDCMRVMVIGIEALSQGGAYGIAFEFLKSHKAMIVLDESSKIKNATAGRTNKAIELAKHCDYRMIMTGTSITQGIHDLYSQFRFLDWRLIGHKSYFTFTHRYCVMGGFEGKQIIGYDNVAELMDRVANNTIVIKKYEMMDLPPKTYERRIVTPSKEQAKALKDLGDPFMLSAVVDDKLLEVETILERMTRYMQIVGGHFPYKEDGEQQIMRFPGKNPKMEALLEIIDEIPHGAKVVIWARFRAEADWIYDELDRRYPDKVMVYNGGTPKADRRRVLDQFQTDPNVKFFLSNPAMGGMGITLTAATYTIYYSNTFSLEDRLQSEDRNHRKGQENKVTYLDITMDHGIDHSMVSALINKKEIADFVTEELRSRT